MVRGQLHGTHSWDPLSLTGGSRIFEGGVHLRSTGKNKGGSRMGSKFGPKGGRTPPPDPPMLPSVKNRELFTTLLHFITRQELVL